MIQLFITFISLSKRSKFLFFISWLGWTFAHGQQAFTGERLSLDENWKFHLGDVAKNDYEYHLYDKNFLPFSKVGRMEGVNALDYNDTAWRTVNLPHDWAIELPFVKEHSLNSHGFKPVGWKYPQTSEGWYRKTINLTDADRDKKIFIKFDGVFRDCQVWFNGYYLGNNMGGYMEFMYDVTDFLNFDQSNLLVVKVDATEWEGWWYEGAGIYRHTWLIKKSKLYIPEHGTYVTSTVKDESAQIFVETNVRNSEEQITNISLKLQLLDQQNNLVAQIEKQLKVDAHTTINDKSVLEVERPKLWSLDDPYLYKLVSTIRKNGTITEQSSVNTGIRTIQFDPDKGFFLNGQSVKIKGVCMHQDHAGVGVALPDRLQYYRIEKLKEMGVNAYRSSHHPPAPEIVAACNELGMLIMPETRTLSSSPEYEDQLRRLILRDRNSPAVFIWSLGNEEMNVQNKETGKRVAESMKRIQRELDPSRLSTYGGNNGNQYEGVNEIMDVRGINYMNISDIDTYHKEHPNQPLIGSEEASTLCTRGQYQMDTIQGFMTDYDKKENIPYGWCANAEEWWSFYDTRDFLMGGFIWTGFDYRGEPSPYRKQSVNSHFGVMDVCGFPKNNYYYYKAWWTDEDVLHLYPHWNWGGRIGDTINVWCQTNAQEVELFLNNKSLGKKQVIKNRHLEWNVPYEPGTLEARAIKSGKQLTTTLETTGVPTQILITPDRTNIYADGQDVSVLNITVLDAKGREVPDAESFIVFDIKGAGKIIGVGNGNPASLEADKILEGAYFRRLFNGKCQVILQSTKTPGEIKFTAISPQLKSASVNITSR